MSLDGVGMIRKRSRPWSHAPLQLALAYAACSGNGGNGANDISLANYEAEFRAALCHYLVLCERMPDQATCIASTNIEESVSFFPTMQVDVAAGRVMFDAQAARACIDGFKGLRSCTQLDIAPVFEQLQDTCAAVFSGTVPPGGACFFDEECTGRDRCSRSCTTPGCCEGTCVPTPPPYPAGGDCSQMPQEWSCAAGTSCVTDPQTQARICAPFLAPGASCRLVAGECPAPYLCRTVPPGDQSVCTPPVERGQSCGGVGDVFFCNDLRDNCNVEGSTCTAAIPVGGACPAGGCVGYASCVGSTCVAQGGPGAGCGTADDCLGQLVCDTTLHCTLPPPGPSCR